MSEKLFHQLHQQRGKRDCGVATLATLIGRSYEETLLAAVSVSPNVWKKGLYSSDLIRIAAMFQTEIIRRTTVDVEEHSGILELKFPSKREHFVLLLNGLIFDPQEPAGQVWDADTYCKKFRAEICGLLQEVE